MATTEKLLIPLLDGGEPFRREAFNDAYKRMDEAALPIEHAETKAHFALWRKNTKYKKQDVVRTPTCPNWGFYMCTDAGTSGEAEPVGYGEGDVIEDGTCTWTLRLFGGATAISHATLMNRNLSDQHKISAITDLAETIEAAGRTAEDNAKNYADQKINALVGGAPEALDTLKELADHLQDHEDVAGTITASLANKVDKVEGKGLSSNDYTAADKTKVNQLTVTKPINLDNLAIKSHEHQNKALLDTYHQTEVNLSDAVKKKHEHANAAVIDQITAKDGQLHYDTVPLAAKKDAIKYALIL